MTFSDIHAYTEESIVIQHGVGRIIPAQVLGQLEHGALVIALTCEQTEFARHITDMHIERYIQL